jgi:hypothetical protein
VRAAAVVAVGRVKPLASCLFDGDEGGGAVEGQEEVCTAS